MAITKSKRTAFTGAHLEPETKEVLEKIARKKNKSVSAFVSEAVEEKLERETTEPACLCTGTVSAAPHCPIHGTTTLPPEVK